MLRNLPVFFRCVRWSDVLILGGVPTLGLAFSHRTPELFVLLCFGLATFLLLAHAFTLNDWADFTQGVHHSNRAMLQLESRDISPRALHTFSLTLLAGALAIFVALSVRSLLLALSVAVLGILYSHPSLNAKSIPIVSTLLHFLGASLDFLFGYVLLAPTDLRGIAISLFFGLTFAAGHPIQEVRDFDEDRRIGARTNAVVFGRRFAFGAGMVLCVLQYLYLLGLSLNRLLPVWLMVAPCLFLPLQLWWSAQALRDGLTSEAIRRFQNRYRILYVLIGLALLCAALYR